jgi:predicted nuclease of predicted toxin-antitoxin system
VKLLIDENLSPRLAEWAAERGIDAVAAIYIGLRGCPDSMLWQRAYEETRVVVTVNVADFISLAQGYEVHPGVIALREAGLGRADQWSRLREAIDFADTHCGGDLLNCVLDLKGPGRITLHPIPEN